MMSNKSGVVKIEGKLFRYDYDRHVVEYVYKAKKPTKKELAEMIADNEEWRAKHGKDLWNLENPFGADEKGYVVIDSVGLRLENWKNKESREEYLSGWAFELDEETSYLAQEFM